MITSCRVSPIITESPFGSSVILESVRLGWYCLNSPDSFLFVLNFSSTPVIVAGIEFFLRVLGRTGVPRGSSDEPGLG